MSARPLFVSLSLFLATGATAAEKAPPLPDQDMLEFLGSFETAQGKALDPFLLDADFRKPAPSGKLETKGPPVRKQVIKETPPQGRERDDE